MGGGIEMGHAGERGSVVWAYRRSFCCPAHLFYARDSSGNGLLPFPGVTKVRCTNLLCETTNMCNTF